MSTIKYSHTTTATPEQFIAALTDFGPGREKLFGKSADGYLKVHSQGPHDADVTEGSGGVWERLAYEWAAPHPWGGPSGSPSPSPRRPDGTTEVHVVNVREGKNLKGRALALVLGTVGKSVLVKEFDKTIKAIEAGTAAASPTNSQPETTSTTS